MVMKFIKGASVKSVKQISDYKNEPVWVRNFRLAGLEAWHKSRLPNWGPDLSSLNVDKINLFKPEPVVGLKKWSEVPKDVRSKFMDLGIPQAEAEFLSGVGAQFDSETVYSNIQSELNSEGVIFCSLDKAIKMYPELVKKYLGTVVPVDDNKFAALNSAAWSGGVFIYVPRGVKVSKPLHAFFLLNGRQLGQFERTLIIAEPDSYVDYIEGCTAPRFNVDTVHCAVVEVIAHKNAQVKYTTIQNWSKQVYNLVTKRATADVGAKIIWLDANFGSKVTMKYPCVILKGENSSAEILSLAVAKSDQFVEAGNKVISLAKNTKASIQSKSVSVGNGTASFRGWVNLNDKSSHSLVNVKCDALLLGKSSKTQTWPTLKNLSKTARINHEATLATIESQQMNYLLSRGLSEQSANSLVVSGFIDVFKKVLPFEYAIELSRLVELEMEGSIG